jgi:hypothetical protein
MDSGCLKALQLPVFYPRQAECEIVPDLDLLLAHGGDFVLQIQNVLVLSRDNVSGKDFEITYLVCRMA